MCRNLAVSGEMVDEDLTKQFYVFFIRVNDGVGAKNKLMRRGGNLT